MYEKKYLHNFIFTKFKFNLNIVITVQEYKNFIKKIKIFNFEQRKVI